MDPQNIHLFIDLCKRLGKKEIIRLVQLIKNGTKTYLPLSQEDNLKKLIDYFGDFYIAELNDIWDEYQGQKIGGNGRSKSKSPKTKRPSKKKKSKKTSPGKKKTSPGKKKTSPGKKKTSPGEKKTSPGKKKTSPGKKKTSPGKKKTSPGKKKMSREKSPEKQSTSTSTFSSFLSGVTKIMQNPEVREFASKAISETAKIGIPIIIEKAIEKSRKYIPTLATKLHLPEQLVQETLEKQIREVGSLAEEQLAEGVDIGKLTNVTGLLNESLEKTVRILKLKAKELEKIALEEGINIPKEMLKEELIQKRKELDQKLALLSEERKEAEKIKDPDEILAEIFKEK
jgi:hypothetical protein